MVSAVLRLHCEDVKGIVYNVSRFIYEHGGNIIDAQQHTEQLDKRFFMWVHFDCTDLAVDRGALRKHLEKLAAQFAMTTELSFSDERKRMAILVSSYDHCLYDLFLRHQYGEIDADIGVVLSNHETLAHVAKSFNVPFVHVPVLAGGKQAAEEEMLRVFREHEIEFLVLARYMQILTPLLVDSYRHRIINVHHGFLPAFKGARPYHQAYEHGVKLIGATSHYVTAELDMGPIIEQETVRVSHSHSVEDLISLGRDVEKKVLAQAVRAHAAGRIMVYRRRTIVFRN
ncbi:MAG: formyltetrahydrofolate deformylase [Candidatus Hydrogenedentes bacterium]|nr:formyltetrahydrofolate deformylase [Candidatus Hydrogenedentota bacterium]